MNWERRGDSQHCKRHSLTFGLTGVCLLCVNDPGALPTSDIETPLPAPPEGCHTSVEHEQWFTELAKSIASTAQGLAKGRARINYSTAAKLYDVAIKSMRTAVDLTTTRERREWVKHMAREARKLRAGARR